MSKIRRYFSKEEKLQILKEADEHGIEYALHKYQITKNLYYNWKSSFEYISTNDLISKYRKVDSKVRDLERENERLRLIIAKQAIFLELKNELQKI